LHWAECRIADSAGIDHPTQAGVSAGLIVGLSDPRLARALVALHRTPGDTWSLARMAEIAGMSRTAFAATFKSVTGTTPAEYLSNWRLTLATADLRAGRPIKIIADEPGYAGASSLSKTFKQRFGHAPRDWVRAQTAAPVSPHLRP
jgi:transcriptional regulator GlxA family with amidase domain